MGERVLLCCWYLHDAGNLFHLTFSWEKGVARVELSHDAAQTPHIDGHTVRMAQDHLRRTVETTLDVGVHYGEREIKIKILLGEGPMATTAAKYILACHNLRDTD